MQVTIIDHTQNAIEKLIYTKATRLQQGAATREMIEAMPMEEKLKELEYMAGTIPSSWEFVHYTFEILGVSRAFTHQLVRTRNASYAQQTMRMVKMEEFQFVTNSALLHEEHSAARSLYSQTMQTIRDNYAKLLELGVAAEDARGILPTNICTNIIAQFSLRTLAEMARSRTGRRTQGEYRTVLEFMLAAVKAVHPWTEAFLFPDMMAKVKLVEAQLARLPQSEQTVVDAYKALDQIRKLL